MTESPEYDVLHQVLNGYRLKVSIFANPTYCGGWQVSTGDYLKAMFHLIGRGRCWLRMRTLPEPVALAAGDLLVLPRAAWHMFSAQPVVEHEKNVVPADTDENPTTLVCGLIEFGCLGRNALVESLPDHIVVRGGDLDSGSSLRQVLKLMIREADQRDYASRLVLDKLADALFVMVLRHHLRASSEHSGFLAGIADPRLRPVLAALHREPSKDWALDEMARIAGISRSVFVAYFKRRTGQTPQSYLTAWRMALAENLIGDPALSVASVAERVGYAAEAAFRRAFKRHFGVGPGRFRSFRRES
jgi:AraC family transcriptional activator of mtrCDE